MTEFRSFIGHLADAVVCTRDSHHGIIGLLQALRQAQLTVLKKPGLVNLRRRELKTGNYRAPNFAKTEPLPPAQ